MPSEIDLRFGKLDRQPAAERIADQLMASIVDRKLDPGAALPSEQRLGEMFGVSRPVIREALRHLSALRIIELAPGRRPRVRPLTGDLLRTFFQWALSLNEASLLELHELRRGVEGECVLLAAQRRTEEEVLALRQLARRMRDCLDDHLAYTELDVQFHLAIADAARNQLLSHLASSIRAPMERTIPARAVADPGGPGRAGNGAVGPRGDRRRAGGEGRPGGAPGDGSALRSGGDALHGERHRGSGWRGRARRLTGRARPLWPALAGEGGDS